MQRLYAALYSGSAARVVSMPASCGSAALVTTWPVGSVDRGCAAGATAWGASGRVARMPPLASGVEPMRGSALGALLTASAAWALQDAKSLAVGVSALAAGATASAGAGG